MLLRENILELGQEYGLQEFEVVSTIEDFFSSWLSAIHRQSVLVRLMEDYSLNACALNTLTGRFETKSITRQALQINKKGMNTIRRQIAQRLNLKAVAREISFLLLKCNKRLVQGSIARVDKTTGTMHVEIKVQENQDPLMAVCEYAHQTPLMRKDAHNLQGATMLFRVRRVVLAYWSGVPRVNVFLDRTSKKIVTALVRQNLQDPAGAYKPICVKRVAGGYSVVLSRKKLPKEVVLAVDRELKERILVLISAKDIDPKTIRYSRGKISCSDFSKNRHPRQGIEYPTEHLQTLERAMTS